MSKKKSGILINTLVLVLVTFVAITALAVVNQVTKVPIAKAEIKARAEVYKVVYPTAEEFEEIKDSAQILEGSADFLKNAGYDGCFINDALCVTDKDGNVKGYVIAATSPSGYGGDIQIAIGVSSDGKITGFNVISNNETAGLGSKCADPEFTSQFKDKVATVLEHTKNGATADNQIDAISGATITTKAVTEAVNAAIVFYQENFGGGLKEKAVNAVVDDAEETADGYKITVTTTKGFAGDIKLALVISKDSVIKGFEIISSNETEGYGAKAQESDYAQQFVGLKADKIKSIKSGANRDNNEIDAISGATYTTNAIDIAVNEAIKYYQENYGGGLSDSFANEDEEAESASADVAASATPQQQGNQNQNREQNGKEGE